MKTTYFRSWFVVVAVAKSVPELYSPGSSRHSTGTGTAIATCMSAHPIHPTRFHLIYSFLPTLTQPPAAAESYNSFTYFMLFLVAVRFFWVFSNHSWRTSAANLTLPGFPLFALKNFSLLKSFKNEQKRFCLTTTNLRLMILESSKACQLEECHLNSHIFRRCCCGC